MSCKVSFLGKQDVKSYNDKVTFVTIKGCLDIPVPIPIIVDNWIKDYLKNSKITFEYIKYTGGYIIGTTGTSKCSDKDTYDLVMGERIAEARAKMALYRFMELLCKKMYIFYKNVLDGESDFIITVSSEKPCLYNVYLKYGMLYDREKEHLRDLINGQSNANSKN